MPAVLAGSNIRKRFPGRRTEAEAIVAFATRRKSSIGRDQAAKLQRQTEIKIEPERPVIRFTRRVGHVRSRNSQISH